eukprot:TRINITY_DN17447_c0_g4_i1.p1 TRINITY_DN17447_c0_g4~~TRINITY_DN17447_c0_g4_i1.p1  ORF type:complete len:315 (+),score=85.05 TRINITY_DN17447_c0_g4_i1:100-945(+)
MSSVWVFLGSSLFFQLVFTWRRKSYKEDLPANHYLFPASSRGQLTAVESALIEAIVLTNLVHNIIVSAFSTYLLFCRKFEFGENDQKLLLYQWSDLGVVPDESKDPSVKYLLMITLGYMTVELTNLVTQIMFNSDQYKNLSSKSHYKHWFVFHCVIFSALLYCIAQNAGYVGFVWGIWGEILAIVSLLCGQQFIGYWRKTHFIAEVVQFVVILVNRILPISWLLYISFCSYENSLGGSCKPVFSWRIVPQVMFISLIGLYNLMLAYSMAKNIKLLFIYMRT